MIKKSGINASCDTGIWMFIRIYNIDYDNIKK